MSGIKTYLYIALLMVTLSASLGCNRESAPDCFQRAGSEQTIRREIEDYVRIELRDYIQIELVDSADSFVEITGPGNLLPEIRTEVSGGTLYIDNRNTCNFVRSFKNRITVRIYAPGFPDIQNYGTGNITSLNTIACQRVRIENRNAAGQIDLRLDADTVQIFSHTGVADTHLSGNAERLELFEQGLGRMNALDLNTSFAFVNNSGINDIYVRSDDYLFAYIRFSGNIYFSGPPQNIDADIAGDGQLIAYP